jgi:hypothetical protein
MYDQFRAGVVGFRDGYRQARGDRRGIEESLDFAFVSGARALGEKLDENASRERRVRSAAEIESACRRFGWWWPK